MPDSDCPAKGSAPGWGRHAVRLVWLVLVLCLPLHSKPTEVQESVAVDPYRVEAAFLRNFARYVTWPPHAFRENGTPWHVGILGPDPFQEFLESTFRGRTEKGRSFEVFRADSLDELPPCHIVFIAFRDAARRQAALSKLKDKPVLTVGESTDFLREGGIIRFQVGKRVRMSVNLDQARFASLGIQTKMLEVADQVIENGEVRKVR